ncbi:MAG: LysR family transcriptional regulator [Myxococcales bacterium]|jgi:DNA-binding transcriptional LysR family regulator
MDYDRLEAFRAVAREDGFTAAARALGKTQSAISQAVAALEEELGQALFVRDGRRVLLTQAGRILLEHAEQAFAQLGAARERLDALTGLQTGWLTIGTSDTLACYALPPALAAFRERHPDVELTLDPRPSPATALAVARREVDLGVITLPLPPDLEHRGRPLREVLRVSILAREPEVLILRPDHPLACRRSIGLRRLGELPLLLLGRGSGGRAWLDAQLARVKVRPRVAMEMNSVELLKRMTALGFGAAVVPARAVQREVCAGELAAVQLRGLRGRRELALLLPQGDPLAPAAARFAELLPGHMRA